MSITPNGDTSRLACYISAMDPLLEEQAKITDIELPDEQHMAIALYLLQKAIALRTQHTCFPTIHACLRDAATHLEKARQFHTKEAQERMNEVERRIMDAAGS